MTAEHGRHRRYTLLSIGLMICLLCFVPLYAEEYIIGSDDVLEISFWQDPKKNDQVHVDQSGMISLDIIGQIKAAGKTPTELQSDIVRRIKPFDKKISQAIVRVLQYNHNFVFVIGQVNKTGKHSFEKIPDLWTLINEAGSTTQFADLSRVTIIRGGKEAGKVEVVDVQKAVTEGKLNELPRIRRLDTIEIPRVPGAVISADLAQVSKRKNLIYVLGSVNNPGPIRYEDNIDVLDALALANGPSENADLKHARLILKDGPFAQTIEFNLKKYSETGQPRRYFLQREDTFILPQKRRGILGVGIPTIAASLGVITSALLLIDRLNGNSSSNVNISTQ